MDNEISLPDSVLEALTRVLQESGVGSIVTAFAVTAEFINPDGDVQLTVIHPDRQSTAQTLGLCQYGEEWTRDDIRRSFDQAYGE